jgi:hypothetical protein
MSEYAYDFVFNYVDITNDGNMITIDETNPVVQSYAGLSTITGPVEFYTEMNRVLGNLHIIRKVHQNIGKLVSFVVDGAGLKFQVSIV